MDKMIKKTPHSHNNQDTKCTEQRKDIENYKRQRTSHI